MHPDVLRQLDEIGFFDNLEFPCNGLRGSMNFNMTNTKKKRL
jgi:hypothetical protein